MPRRRVKQMGRKQQKAAMAKMTKKGQAFVSKHIGIEMRAGFPPKQAQAMAYSKARKAGFKVPKLRR